MDNSLRSNSLFKFNVDELPPAIRLKKRGSIYDPYEGSIIHRSKLALSMTINPDLKSEQGLTVLQAALSYISTIVGAGIVSLPYSMYEAGWVFGISLHIFFISLLLITALLYLKAKDNLGYESYGELAFICLGRTSVFLLNFIICFGTTLIAIFYITLFSKICVSLVENYVELNKEASDSTIVHFLGQKLVYCLFIYVALFFVILKKDIKELKAASVLLFVGLISLILGFCYIVFFEKRSNEQQITQNMVKYEKGSIFDSISIILTSYGFTINFFPIYSSIEKRNNKKGISALFLALLFAFIIYASFSYLGIKAYRDCINPDIFVNLKASTKFTSFFIRGLFLCIFLCNIPFMFLPGKEALLIIVDEIQNHTMSKQLMKRIDMINNGGLMKGQISINYEPSFEGTHHRRVGSTQTHNLSPQHPKNTSFQHQDLTQIEDEDGIMNSHKISESVPERTYRICTIMLFTFQVIMAFLINDLTILFGFFAAITESMLNFILPALFYLISSQMMQKKPNPILKFFSILFVFMGICLFVFANYNNISKMI